MMFAYPSPVESQKIEHLPVDLEMALLRHYEPVLRFTQGERFFPVDVERYVQRASLWYQRPGDDPVCVLRAG